MKRAFMYETVYLPTQEYAKIVSEINSNFDKYRLQKIAIHMSYGTDGRPYWYYFEIRGYDDYNFYAVMDMEESDNE